MRRRSAPAPASRSSSRTRRNGRSSRGRLRGRYRTVRSGTASCPRRCQSSCRRGRCTRRSSGRRRCSAAQAPAPRRTRGTARARCGSGPGRAAAAPAEAGRSRRTQADGERAFLMPVTQNVFAVSQLRCARLCHMLHPRGAVLSLSWRMLIVGTRQGTGMPYLVLAIALLVVAVSAAEPPVAAGRVDFATPGVVLTAHAGRSVPCVGLSPPRCLAVSNRLARRD